VKDWLPIERFKTITFPKNKSKDYICERTTFPVNLLQKPINLSVE
jgi:hypothetical protein